MTTPGLRFGGRLARAGRPPLVWATAWAVGLISLGGCIGGGEPLPALAPGAPVMADEARLESLAEALAEAETAEARTAVLERALRSAGVAPLADAEVPGGIGQYRMGGTLAGWIVGRHPVQRDSLVVVRAPIDGSADLALIEAARLLVARSVYTQTPERSVLVVLGDDAAPALRLWDRSLVVGAIRVGPGPGSLVGRPVRVLPPGDPSDLAVRLFHAAVGAANPSGSIYTAAEPRAE